MGKKKGVQYRKRRIDERQLHGCLVKTQVTILFNIHLNLTMYILNEIKPLD